MKPASPYQLHHHHPIDEACFSLLNLLPSFFASILPRLLLSLFVPPPPVLPVGALN